MPYLLLDTNLLVLLLIGRTDRRYIRSHKRTAAYDATDFDQIEQLILLYRGVVTIPHVLSETSNFLRQIGNPARDRIQNTFRDFIAGCREQSIASADGCRHEQFIALGLTDATILVACESSVSAADRIELLTADNALYHLALSLGLPAEFYA